MRLTRLIYSSENQLGNRMIGDLNAILDVSTRNNEKTGITGALLFDTLWFIQVLEGEREAVSTTLRRIITDERHTNLTIMDSRPIEHRLFGNWWMGLSILRGDMSGLYRKHGIGERLDPRRISGDQALALAVDLAAAGLDRRLAPNAA
jgi:hypothetical protein